MKEASIASSINCIVFLIFRQLNALVHLSHFVYQVLLVDRPYIYVLPPLDDPSAGIE